MRGSKRNLVKNHPKRVHKIKSTITNKIVFMKMIYVAECFIQIKISLIGM